MHADRLYRLAELLDEDAKKPDGAKFDLGTWAAPATSEELSYYHSNEEPIKADCGTKACALGLAAISGEFAKYGLTCEFIKVRTDEALYMMVPNCDGATGFDAGAQLFDISTSDSRYLFDPDCYDGTPRAAQGEMLVARRIRAFARGEIDAEHYPSAGFEEE